MITKQSLADLYAFMLDMRRSGTTSTIKEIAEQKDVWVIVSDSDAKRYLMIDDALSISDTGCPVKIDKRPVLFDNAVIIEILEFAIKRMELLKHDLDLYHTRTHDIHNIIVGIEDQRVTR
jgi:hypothetical protein